MKTNAGQAGLIFELVDCGRAGHAVVGAFCVNCGRSTMAGFCMPGLRMRVAGEIQSLKAVEPKAEKTAGGVVR